MKSTNPVLIVLLCLGTVFVTSCNRPAPEDGAKSPDTRKVGALCPVGDTVVIKDIKECSILIPEKATAQEKYSAAMLTDYFGKIFTVKLPVVQEPQVVKGKIISVGNTAAAMAAKISADPREQAYKLAVSNGNLYVLGGTRGPLYGVIALLEEDLGCRWYQKDDAPVIPVHSEDELTVVPRSYSPPFEIRNLLYQDAFNSQWAAFNRLQPLSRSYKLTQEHGGGLANPDYFIHTYRKLIPTDKYFTSNPEYFPLRNGKRFPSQQHNGQLCYSSPGVIKVIVETLDAEIAKNPGTRIYSVSANDNEQDNCECPSCQEIIKVDGTSGAQLYLANEVANRLAVKHPEIKITTLAYNQSQKPPKNIKPGPNTVIFYAPIRQRQNPISKLLPIGEIGVIADELAGWHKIADHIYLWDYVDYLKHVPVPFPIFDAQDRGLQFLINNGVTGMFFQGAYVGHGSLGELKAWLFAKKFWNPQWPQNELIEEFIASYYGPVAKEMAEYVSLQRRAWANWYGNRKPGEGLTFSKAEIEQMYKLLNSALAHCDKQPEYRVKIERELLTLLCLSLSKNPTKETAASYAETLKQVEELIIKHNVKAFGLSGLVETKMRMWRKRLKKAIDGDLLPKYSKNSVTMRKENVLYKGHWYEYLPDSDSLLGHAFRQHGGNRAWGVQWPFDDFIDLLKPGKVYIVRMRVRPEFKTIPQNSGSLFTFNFYTFGGAAPGSGGKVFRGNFSANDNCQYRWIELGKLRIDTPTAAGYLYCVPGKDLTKDDAVWYDYMEFVPEDEFKDADLAAKLPVSRI